MERTERQAVPSIARVIGATSGGLKGGVQNEGRCVCPLTESTDQASAKQWKSLTPYIEVQWKLPEYYCASYGKATAYNKIQTITNANEDSNDDGHHFSVLPSFARR